jgi:dihydroorotate dehydrogenase
LGDCTHEIPKSLRLIPAVTFRHCVIKTPVSSRRFMYKLLRNFLFLFPAESVHHFSMKSLKLICNLPGGKKIVASLFSAQHSQFGKQIFNLRFSNPIGLGAGFDKNALYLNELEALGFGFVEIGTVTPLPQAGNDRPRLFRLKKDRALINRMGFNNDGVKVIAERLRTWNKLQYAKADGRLIIGGNIGKNKITPNEEAWKDYEICFRELFDCVDYFVVNVSSPNTPGLRELQEKDSLKKIIGNLQSQDLKGKNKKPILLKIAPDLSTEQIDDVIDLAKEISLDGLIITNTTISRADLVTEAAEVEKIGGGGLSGAPLKKRSTEVLKYIFEKSNGSIPIIASGGIFDTADAKEKIAAGASLLQVWTGFIYEGPAIVKKVLKGI